MTMGRWTAVASATLCSFAAFAADTAPSAPRGLTLEDSEAIKSPDSPAISRDGKLVAYVADDRIFVVPLSREVRRAVTATGSDAGRRTGRRTVRRFISRRTA
jgi:hypothetical protein